MTKNYASLLSFLFLFLFGSVSAQEANPWSRADVSNVSRTRIQSKVKLERYSGFALDRGSIERSLLNVPSRRSASSRPDRLMKFPDKDGRMVVFRVKEAPVMSPELAEKFPDDKSYAGEAIDGSQEKDTLQSESLRPECRDHRARLWGPVH